MFFLLKSSVFFLVWVVVICQDDGSNGGCAAIPPGMTAPKTGRKAWDKCIEYQERLVYPCVKGVPTLTGDQSRVSRCGHEVMVLIGGTGTTPKEFPHMVFIGFGVMPNSSTEYVCGGSIVSDRYLLTAGHCTFSRDHGDIAYAVLGADRRSQQVDSTKLYKIKRIIKHPDYKLQSRYNDIALLELERPIQLNENTVPICLPIEDADISKAYVTWWGTLHDPDSMQRMPLNKFSTAECQTQFLAARQMKRGFDEATQLCFGDRTVSKDTYCQGYIDGGVPVQIKNQHIRCMYNIVGVKSFSRVPELNCEPGLYTRVAPFVPWIESVVWP